MMVAVVGDFVALITLVLTSPLDSLLHLLLTIRKPKVGLKCYSNVSSVQIRFTLNYSITRILSSSK